MGTPINGVLYIFLIAFMCWSPVSSVNYKPIGSGQISPVVSNTSPVKPSPNNPKAVELFNKYFQSEVKKCAQLSDLFDVANVVSRDEIANAIFYLVTTFQGDVRYETAAQNAFNSQRYVTSVDDKPTPQLLLDVYSNAASLYLDQQGYLYNENARNLAGRYALLLKEAAVRTVKKDCPRSKLAAVIIGLKDFYKEENFFTQPEVGNISDLYGSLWYGRNGTGTPGDRSTEPKFYPKPPALKECNKLCSVKSKAIDLFTSTFRNAVVKSETLKDLFNVYSALTPAEVSRGLFYSSLYYLQFREVKDAADEADFMARYARDVKSLKPQVVEQVHSRSMAKILEAQKILTIKNAKSLAEDYAKAMEDNAMIIVNPKYPKSKVVTWRLVFGLYYKLAGAVVDMTRDAFPALAYYYGNEWRCQSL